MCAAACHAMHACIMGMYVIVMFLPNAVQIYAEREKGVGMDGCLSCVLTSLRMCAKVQMEKKIMVAHMHKRRQAEGTHREGNGKTAHHCPQCLPVHPVPPVSPTHNFPHNTTMSH